MGVSLHRGSNGETGGVSLAGTFLREKNSISVDPEDIKTLSFGAIWNFDKGTGLS